MYCNKSYVSVVSLFQVIFVYRTHPSCDDVR